LVQERINAMRRALRASSFVPPGFVVDDATADGEAMMITVRAVIDTGACPGCGHDRRGFTAGIRGVWRTCRWRESQCGCW
jgi:hypothetical protein